MSDRDQVVDAITAIELIDGTHVEEDRAAALSALCDLKTAIEEDVEERVHEESISVPDDWEEHEWEEAIEDARKNVDTPVSRGTITEKTINGHDYFYLQWREGDGVKSQYIAPVSPE